TTYPVLEALNIMHLATPQSAILSAVIFNALIIIALIPLALKGVRYRAIGAAAVLRRHVWIYGVGGIIIPFPGIKLVDMILVALHLVKRSPPMLAHIRPAIVSLILLSVVTGIVYPAIVTAIAQIVFPHQANGSLIVKDGKVVGSALIGQ